MIDNSFNLNIDKYSIEELIDVFNLPPNYTRIMIGAMGDEIIGHITGNNSVSESVKNETVKFVINARNILEEEYEKKEFAMKPVEVTNSSNHMVQMKEKKTYSSTYPSEYFPGIINPLERKINVEYLNIDSQFRENYTTTYSSNFHITLPLQINNVLSMRLESIEIPKSFYAVSEQHKNNCFSIKIGNSFKLIIIPNGSYTYCEIIETINAILAAEGGDFLMIKFTVLAQYENGNGPTFVTVDPLYEHLGHTIELNFQPSDSYQCLPLLFGWMLGFRQPYYVGSSHYVSEGPISISGPKYVYLVIEDFNNSAPNSFYGAFTSSILDRNILAKITMPNTSTATTTTSVSANNLIVASLRKYYGPVNLLKLQIQLIDEYGRIVNLNSMDYSFCLTLQTVYNI